ncbi:PTS transporter subunit EIIC [Streptomyces goshikiensis]|uniref:PTS transporter subunit EIIC n=1 Tax=Streptomyces goshikiensis TaxID=1942 RepID=UPI003696D40F
MSLQTLLRRQQRPATRTLAPPAPERTGARSRTVDRLRRMGLGLSLPIAAMPAAGVLLRLGQDDMLGRVPTLHQAAAVISGAGSAVLDQLPLLFALGVGFGLNRSTNTASRVLACALSYLILARAVTVLNPLDKLDTPPARWPYGALLGIVGALLAMSIWKLVERRKKTPPTFAVYGLVALAALTAGTLLGLAYPTVDRALTAATATIADNAVAGGGIFGFINRLLLPLGLHHVPSTVVWYVTGDCGDGVRGDMPCFLQQHDPDAGIFMTGFFPVAMAGLPAAALAMWRSALPEHRRRVATVLLPAAAMSAIAGITEPIEFAFAFISLPLLLIHAVLTGLSLALVNWLDVHSGFVFSAGLIDYLFNYPISTKPLLLLPISAAYGALYYTVFRFAITRFNLRTPGRTAEPEDHRTEGASP